MIEITITHNFDCHCPITQTCDFRKIVIRPDDEVYLYQGSCAQSYESYDAALQFLLDTHDRLILTSKEVSNKEVVHELLKDDDSIKYDYSVSSEPI